MGKPRICPKCGGDQQYTGHRRGCLCVEVGPKHPLWDGWDDDDWNGATGANWVTTYAVRRAHIVLVPPDGISPDQLGRMCLAFIDRGATVEVRKHRAPNAAERALGEGAHLSNDDR
jgi:hypothetical protein